MQILATSLHADDDDDDDDGVGPWLFGLCILQSKRVAPRASARNVSQFRATTTQASRDNAHV